MNSVMPKERFVFLDGMRGIAAFIVVLLHVSRIFNFEFSPNAPLAVDFFFCLSGFVISHAYDSKISATGIGNFMQRRLERLYPMIFVGTILAALAGATVLYTRGAGGWGLLAFRVALEFAVVPMLVGALAFPLNVPMWSLLFELLASLGYACERGRLSSRNLLAANIVMGALLGTLIALAGHIDTFGVGGKVLPVGLLRAGFAFGTGVWFHRSGVYRRAVAVPRWVLAAALTGLLLAPTAGAFGDIVLALVVMPGLVLLGSAARSGSSPSPMWEWSGRLSYPLYVVHWPVLIFVSAALGRSAPAAAIGLVATVAVAWMALVTFDEPLRNTLADRRRRMRAA